MSFDRIPIGNLFNHALYDHGPRSTQIKEDVILTFTTLNSIKSTIKSEDMCDEYLVNDVKNRLENVIKVYNENVQYINSSIENPTEFESCSYEQYCKGRYPIPSRSDFQYEESLRKTHLLKQINEESQISQLGYIFRDVAKKITRTIDRFNAVVSSSPTLRASELIAPKNRHAHDFYAPTLRIIKAPIIETKTPKRAPLSHSEFKQIAAEILQKLEALPNQPSHQTSLGSQQPEILAIEILPSAPVETITVPAPAAPKIDVTVLCNLAPGQTLGICCDPTWDKQPTAFIKGDNGWKGEVPVNQDWKFVILDASGKVANWEKEKNRRCNEQTQPFTVKATEVRF